MTGRVQAILMLLFGGALVKISLNGSYLRYVKAGLQPLLVIAGVVLIATALFTMWHEFRPVNGKHGHDHPESRVGWLLLIPALTLLLISPAPLSSFAADKTGTVAVSAESDYPPLPAGDPVELPLLEYAARALLDDGRSLTGRTVRLTGFVTAGPGGRPALARIVLTCCAADGRPIKVSLTGKPLTGVADGTWIQLDGRYSPDVRKDALNDADIAAVEVTTWQEIPTPEQPYD